MAFFHRLNPYISNVMQQCYGHFREREVNNDPETIATIARSVDCEQSLVFFRLSEGSARERRAAKPREARNESRSPRRKTSNLSNLAPLVTRVVICVSRTFCSTDQEERETARSLRFPCKGAAAGEEGESVLCSRPLVFFAYIFTIFALYYITLSWSLQQAKFQSVSKFQMKNYILNHDFTRYFQVVSRHKKIVRTNQS